MSTPRTPTPESGLVLGLESSGAEEVSWICKLCEKEFSGVKCELLECEYCDKHFCRKCLGLSAAEYKLFAKRSDLHWYCPPCEEKAVKSIRIEKEIEERCKDYFSKFEKRLNDLEEKISQKTSVEDVQKLIKESEKSGVSVENVQIVVNEQLSEFRESEQRKLNVIIFNAKESDKREVEVRKDEDLKLLDKLCKIVKSDISAIKNVTRLGKRVVNEGGNVETRPMKVVFEDMKSKSKFMSNLSNLASASEDLRSLSVAQDMTPKERGINKMKLAEAKQKNEELASGDFKFVVRGPPWERKVMKVKVNLQ